MGISYGELSELEKDFEKQCDELGIEWVDDDVRTECLTDFISQYENGNCPIVMLCGYGYKEVED